MSDKDKREVPSSARSLSAWLARTPDVLLFLGVLLGVLLNGTINQALDWIEDIPSIPMEPYPEAPWRTESTISARVVASTPYARFEVHKVRAPNGKIIDDWLWEDERSHVNVVVHLANEDRFLLFEQMKYGFDGPKMAIVGGLFNPGDTPLGCAERELREETNLVATKMFSLGSYRVQANRGGGILHTFFAHGCLVGKGEAPKHEADYEQQKVLKLTRKELETALLDKQSFGEIQHAGTVAMALAMDSKLRNEKKATFAGQIVRRRDPFRKKQT